MTNLNIAQICKVLEYIKAHEENPSKLNNSHSTAFQPTKGCDIYNAIEKKEIQITYDQLDFFFRKLGLIQKTMDNKNFNSLDFQMSKDDWQGKLIQITGLGQVLQNIFHAILDANPRTL